VVIRRRPGNEGDIYTARRKIATLFDFRAVLPRREGKSFTAGRAADTAGPELKREHRADVRSIISPTPDTIRGFRGDCLTRAAVGWILRPVLPD
jgi:hypothetical protein